MMKALRTELVATNTMNYMQPVVASDPDRMPSGLKELAYGDWPKASGTHFLVSEVALAYGQRTILLSLKSNQ